MQPCWRLLNHKVRSIHSRRKAWTAIPCGKVKLIIITETILIPHRRKPRTHGRESTIDLFNENRIVLEIGALLADRPGITRLN